MTRTISLYALLALISLLCFAGQQVLAQEEDTEITEDETRVFEPTQADVVRIALSGAQGRLSMNRDQLLDLATRIEAEAATFETAGYDVSAINIHIETARTNLNAIDQEFFERDFSFESQALFELPAEERREIWTGVVEYLDGFRVDLFTSYLELTKALFILESLVPNPNPATETVIEPEVTYTFKGQPATAEQIEAMSALGLLGLNLDGEQEAAVETYLTEQP